MGSSGSARGGKPNEQDEDKIEKNGQKEGPKIILGLIEDISGNSQEIIFLDLLLFFC
jgi:hypothetical protein